MENIKAFWARVREEEDKLEDKWPYIVSLDDSSRGIVGGRFMQVSRLEAAKQIVNKSARLATKREIAAETKKKSPDQGEKGELQNEIS
jgi:hypothetical protein